MELATLVNFAKAIGDGIVIAIIIILYLIDRKKKNKQAEEDKAELDRERKEYKEEYKNLVKEIIDGVNSHHLTPQESKSVAQIEKQINDTIQEILEKTNASRVCVVKYHNGQRDMTGMAFLKMSMTNEVVNRGVVPLMGDFKDLFRSYLAYWCHELEINGKCIIKDTNDKQNIDINMYEYLKTRNIEAKYGIALTNLDGDVIGFLCVEYLNGKDFNLKNIEEVLHKQGKKIETLITLNGMEERNYEL